MNKKSDRRFAYLMLLPAALIVVVTGCSSIPTANIHPAKPVGKRQFGIQSDYLFAYDPVSMVSEIDYDEFKDMRMPCVTIAGRYGITDKTELNLMVYVLPVGFETYAKRCLARNDHRWLSFELGAGCNIQTKDSDGAANIFLVPLFFYQGFDFPEIKTCYYNNYYFYSGILYEYYLPSDLGFNARLSGYCANVNIKAVTEDESANYFHRLFFPQFGFSIISPDWGGRLALNFDVIYFENPIDDEWYPGYSFGISGYGKPFSKKIGDNYE